jgi:hypothetical protein
MLILKVILTILKTVFIFSLLTHFWVRSFELREELKSVIHYQSKNHLTRITFHHDRISNSGSYEHLNTGATNIDAEAEHDQMSQEEHDAQDSLYYE